MQAVTTRSSFCCPNLHLLLLLIIMIMIIFPVLFLSPLTFPSSSLLALPFHYSLVPPPPLLLLLLLLLLLHLVLLLMTHSSPHIQWEKQP